MDSQIHRIRDANPTVVVVLFFFMKVLPMLISGGCIYLGYKLFILGVTGQASLSIESSTVSGQLLNAAPGLFFAIGGIVVLVFAIVKGAKIDFDDADDTGYRFSRKMHMHRGG